MFVVVSHRHTVDVSEKLWRLTFIASSVIWICHVVVVIRGQTDSQELTGQRGSELFMVPVTTHTSRQAGEWLQNVPLTVTEHELMVNWFIPLCVLEVHVHVGTDEHFHVMLLHTSLHSRGKYYTSLLHYRYSVAVVIKHVWLVYTFNPLPLNSIYMSCLF